MPKPINRHQPIRPEKSQNGARLLYRVHPILKDNNAQGRNGRVYRTHEPANQLAQMQLYRWCRSEDYVQLCSCRELYEILIQEPFSKMRYASSINHFGRTVINAVDYNPRILKAKDKFVEKTQQVYYFHEREDLQYGLEYMICAWLRKFLNESSAPGSVPLSGPEDMLEELDILADTPFDDYVGLYVEPLQSIERRFVEEPNWRELKRAAASERIVDENGIPVLDGGFEEADRPRESARKLTRFNPQ